MHEEDSLSQLDGDGAHFWSKGLTLFGLTQVTSLAVYAVTDTVRLVVVAVTM